MSENLTPTDIPLKVNLLDYSLEALIQFCVALGEKPFRAKQLLKWIHKHGVDDFERMSDLSKSLRLILQEKAIVKAPEIVTEQISSDGTIKWLCRLDDNNQIETVFIPENTRGTLCVSSQVGCALNCSFCSTAKQGFNRNLRVSEIIGQVWLAQKRLRELNNDPILKVEPKINNDFLAKGEQVKTEYELNNDPLSKVETKLRTITNVVMMGMGEPLLNFEALVSALSIMREDLAYTLPRRRVTVSTAGIVPKIARLREEAEVALAISLHAPNDELRNELVPLNKKYPIRELISACKDYLKNDERSLITIEYVMLRGINDHLKHAKELVKVLQGLRCKVNLIPFNPHFGTEYERSYADNIQAFRMILVKAGLVTTIRKTRGDDIDAACGQLAGKIMDKTRRSKDWKIKLKLKEEETWIAKSA